MSTLRIHGIEAKSDPTSASVNEKIKITNSNGELLLHLDGTKSGIGTVGITTTGTTFHVDRATGEITFVTDAKFNGTVGIAGTLTYEDVTNIDAIGIITARAGINVSGGTITGDGSGLTGLPAGLGTALSQTQTDPLNKIYYTNKVLSISTTTTIDHPATANLAYTQYGDIKIEDGHDLIIKDDDDFKYDILGISTTKLIDKFLLT